MNCLLNFHEANGAAFAQKLYNLISKDDSTVQGADRVSL